MKKTLSLTFVAGTCLLAGCSLSFQSSASFNSSPMNPPVNQFPHHPYGFEDGTEGWVAQIYPGCQACLNVTSSEEQAKEGQHSLKMLLHLVPGDDRCGSGEAYMLMGPEDGTRDLIGRTVTAWVYAPTNGTDKPASCQLFVKDDQWRNKYGTLTGMVAGQWIQLSLTVNTEKPPDGWVDGSFDPHQVLCVGVKVVPATGSATTYDGPVYVDAVTW